MLSRERRPSVFENRMLRKIFEPKRNKITGTGEDCITWSLMICIPRQILFGLSYQQKLDAQGMWHVWSEEERCILGFE